MKIWKYELDDSGIRSQGSVKMNEVKIFSKALLGLFVDKVFREIL